MHVAHVHTGNAQRSNRYKESRCVQSVKLCLCSSDDAQVRGKKLHHYSGSYSNFMDQRTMRANQAASILAKEQEEIARLEDFIARFGAKVRLTD